MLCCTKKHFSPIILQPINKALVISLFVGVYPCSSERPENFVSNKSEEVMCAADGGSHQKTENEI